MDEKGKLFLYLQVTAYFRRKTLFDLRSITEINYYSPLSIQKFVFSNQSLTKGVQWNRTSRAIAAQEGVSIAKGGQESNSAYNFSIYLRYKGEYLTNECL